MSTISNSLSSQVVSDGSTTAVGSNSSAALTSEDTFLKLLVAQIKNQDPTNPTDSTQFVGQLTQYSELEQLININSGVQKLGTASTDPTTTTTDTSTKPTAG